MQHITEEQFTSRFVSLILGGRDLPKKPLDLHILYLSAILRLHPQRQYSEAALNEELRRWTERYGANFALDHVTLRRYLIDAGYIQRDAAGNAYALREAGIPFSYDPALRDIDLEALLEGARREREERKQRYLKASQGRD